MINSIIIDPGHGYIPQMGYQRGHAVNWISESDIIDLYVPGIIEELELERLRYKVLPTRKHPGMTLEEKKKEIIESSLVISCHVGLKENEPVNGSRVLYNNAHSKELAQKLSRVCHQWGKAVNWLHANLGIKRTSGPLLDIFHATVVELEPFQIDFPDIRSYTEGLDRLGHQIGRLVAEYAKAESPNSSLRFHQANLKNP
jgi:N-acetylmuramoyl-L-alanine amidase